MKSLLRLIRGLFHDLERLHPGVSGLDRDLQTIEARVEEEGEGFLSVALPAYGKSFDQALATGRIANIAGFKRVRGGQIPRFLSGIVSNIFDTKTGLLMDSPSVECILSIRQICYLCKKYLPSDSRASTLETQAKKDFEKTEAQIIGLFPPDLDLLGRVASFCLVDLERVNEFKGRHGPGAVFEGYSPNQKWDQLYRRLVDYDDRLMSLGYDIQAFAWNPILEEESSNSTALDTCSRLVTVPKSCSALRTITVEPSANQFMQQALNSVLRTEIRKCPILSRCLNLDSQKPNQQLALEGSLHRTWATMDLSSASDLMSNELVHAVFRKFPNFLGMMQRSRTPETVLSEDLTMSLKKYAGMGNATTFPVQSIVFAIIAITAITSSSKRLTSEKVRNAAKCVRVFGDDIIIKTEHYARVAEWIEFCGLKINRGKTFSEGNFRESCGVDAYMGVDVTPVYLRHDPQVTSTEPNRLASLVSTSNQLWLRGYYRCSDVLKKVVEKALGPLPLVSNTSSGLGWQTRQNAVTYQRWSRHLHRPELKTYVPTPIRRADKLDGYPALMKFFHSPRNGEYDPEHLSSSVRKFQLKLRKRWVHG
jgi:hypothetical protein